MLNSAASALVDSDSAGTDRSHRREIIGRNIASEYGNLESNTETLKEQLESLNVRNKDSISSKLADSSRCDKMTSQISTGKENGYDKTSQLVENVAERKQTERGKRVLPATPKSLYSTPSSASINQPPENVTLNSKRLSSTSSLSSSNTTSSLSSEDDLSRSKTKQTHITVYKFVARHEDEINLETGDAVHVSKKCEDLWFEGINLRTGESGCFPSRYVSDILRDENQDNSLNESQVNQFSVRFLGSVEVNGFKGNDIICDAMKEIVKQHQLTSTPKPPACILDVSERGIRIIEHPRVPEGRKGSVSGKKSSKRKLGKIFEKDSKEMSAQSHYFALKNVTFCGCHPQNARFFAFITKHPEDHRFACHVFMSDYSTEPVANAVGRAFKKFYAEFLDYQAPIEDFYIE